MPDDTWSHLPPRRTGYAPTTPAAAVAAVLGPLLVLGGALALAPAQGAHKALHVERARPLVRVYSDSTGKWLLWPEVLGAELGADVELIHRAGAGAPYWLDLMARLPPADVDVWLGIPLHLTDTRGQHLLELGSLPWERAAAEGQRWAQRSLPELLVGPALWGAARRAVYGDPARLDGLLAPPTWPGLLDEGARAGLDLVVVSPTVAGPVVVPEGLPVPVEQWAAPWSLSCWWGNDPAHMRPSAAPGFSRWLAGLLDA